MLKKYMKKDENDGELLNKWEFFKVIYLKYFSCPRLWIFVIALVVFFPWPSPRQIANNVTANKNIVPGLAICFFLRVHLKKSPSLKAGFQ